MMNKEYLRRAIFKVLKKSKFIFNSLEWITGYKDIRNQKRNHQQNSFKTNSVIIKEIQLIRRYWHSGVFHYFRYGLPYVSLTEEELLNYVPTYYHHKQLEKDHLDIDTVKYGNKLVQSMLFKDRDIPTAEVIAFNKGSQWFNFFDEKKIDIVNTIQQLLESETQKLFFKPTGGQGGSGIFVLKKIGHNFIVNGNKIDLLVFLQSINKTTFIIQKGIIQSEQMMNINPSSVNTLRVVVQKDDKQMKMKTCIIRMGRKGKEIDNSAQGGISVKVDIETGKVAEAATAEHGGDLLTCHPDTNKSFSDITINNWGILKKEIEVIGTKLIDFKNIALDIAVTDDGAKLLEFNFRYGIEHQQCVLGGVRKLLNIYPK